MSRVLVAVLLALSLLGLAPAAGAEPAAPRPRPAGRWLLDEQGRVRIDHGVHMVYKRPPYAADAAGFGDDDARFLARNGFTTVRLGMTWKAVEPRPGRYDAVYLARVRRTVRTLHRHGIVALLDFHQGPDGVGLQDRYAAAWRHVARELRGTPGVQGFDILNEPFQGSQWATCLNPVGCPAYDATLTEFTQRVVDAIRSVDRRTPVYYEPNLFFNDGIPTYVAPEGRRLAFSFHDYCGTSAMADSYGPECDVVDGRTFANAEAQAADHEVAPMLTEFGATDDPATLHGVVDLAMRHRMGWQFWAYCGCEDPTTTGPGDKQALVADPAKPPQGSNLDMGKLRALAVPHPLRVAGTPVAYHFDRDTGLFTLR